MKKIILAAILATITIGFSLVSCTKEELKPAGNAPRSMAREVGDPTPVDWTWKPNICLQDSCWSMTCIDPVTFLPTTWQKCKYTFKVSPPTGSMSTFDYNGWIYLEDPALNPAATPYHLVHDPITNTYSFSFYSHMNGDPCSVPDFKESAIVTFLIDQGYQMFSYNPTNYLVSMNCLKVIPVWLVYNNPFGSSTAPAPGNGAVRYYVKCCGA